MNGLLINLKRIMHVNGKPIPESSLGKNQMDYSSKSKLDLLIICILLINLIVIHLLEFIFFYLSYSEEIIEIFISFEYFHFYYLLLLIIVSVIRIIIAIYLAYFFFKKWMSQKIRHFLDIPFLFGLFFYFNSILKSLDLVVFFMYLSDGFFSDTIILNLFKIRSIIGGLSALFLISIGAYLFFFNRNLNKKSLEREKVARKNMKIVLVIWTGLILSIIFFSPNIFFLLAIYVIFCFVLCFIIWIFIKAHKGKILSEINCLIISLGFTFYLIFHFLPTLLILTILGTSIYGVLIATLIGEIGILISFIIILIGFKNKAKY